MYFPSCYRIKQCWQKSTKTKVLPSYKGSYTSTGISHINVHTRGAYKLPGTAAYAVFNCNRYNVLRYCSIKKLMPCALFICLLAIVQFFICFVAKLTTVVIQFCGWCCFNEKWGNFMTAIFNLLLWGICECLHIQKCLLDDSLQVYQFWCIYQKVHNRLDMLDYTAALVSEIIGKWRRQCSRCTCFTTKHAARYNCFLLVYIDRIFQTLA